MAAARRKNNAGKKLKKSLQKSLISLMNRVDFLKVMEKMHLSQRGEPWRERFKDTPTSWPDLEGLNRKAAELICEQLGDEGRDITFEEAAELVSGITTHYDHDLHRQACTAVTLLMTTMFSHHQGATPFCSPDGRELAHIDKLKGYLDKGLGTVYLANHSSHLDEFLLDCQIMQNDLTLPLFAAGANMFAVPSLGKVLRLGSYVVQRRGASRKGLSGLYNYCRAISETGGQQAIFLEAWHGGARSRDGSLRYPRRLVTLRGALKGETDRVIQPVAISYDIIPEDLSLAARKGAGCWFRGVNPLGALFQMILHPKSWMWRVPFGLYGRAYVTFPEPRLLSELKEEHAKDPGGLKLDEFVALYSIRQIAKAKKVMASQLTARALMRARSKKERDLAKVFQEELELLREYHQATFGQEPDLEDFIRNNPAEKVVAAGLSTLRKRKVVARLARDANRLPLVKSEAGLGFYATHGDRRIYSPTADENIVVVGAGDWGFALTHFLGSRILEDKHYLNASLTLFDPRVEIATEMGVNRRPPGRFNEYRLPKNSFVTFDPQSAFKKASDVILIAPPEELAAQAELMLEHSTQPMRLAVATCSFEPEGHRLPCQVVYDLLRKKGRDDVLVYAITGAVQDEDLLKERELFAILAGPDRGRNKLAELFKHPRLELALADDPLGVQAATILARIYALWVHFMVRRGELKGAGPVGTFVAGCTAEAARLALALGAKPETFSMASPAWTSVFTSEALTRRYREFAGLLAAAERRGRTPFAAEKAFEQSRESGATMNAYQDLRSAHYAASELGVDAPILERAWATIWGEK